MVVYFVVFQFSLLWLFILGFILFQLKNQRKQSRIIILIISFLFSVYIFYENQQQLPEELPSNTELSIQMDSIQINGAQLSFIGQYQDKFFQCFYRLASENEQKFWEEYDKSILKIKYSGEAMSPETQRNLNGFDYKKYLMSKKITQVIQISQITQVKTDYIQNFKLFASLIRRKLICHIDRSFKRPIADYMLGLLLGFSPKRFDESLDLYSSLGIIHLFAISGMQVGFFINKIKYIALRLGVIHEHLIYFELLFSLFYAIITGFQISIIRALVSNILQHFKITDYQNLALTFLLILFVNPFSFLGQSAQLSFILAFILLQLKPLSNQANGLLNELKYGGLISVGVLPVLLLYFYEFQPFSIILTLLFSYLFDYLILPMLVILLFLSYINFNFDLNFMFIALEKAIKWVANFTMKPIIFGKPEPLVFLLLIITVFFLFDTLYFKQNIKKHCVVLIFLVMITKFQPFGIFAMVDIGQGDCLVIQAPFNRQTTVIDVGGRLEFKQEEWTIGDSSTNAEKTLVPFLKSRGISKIDQLIATHADEDHIGDLASVAQVLPIKSIITTRGSLTRENFLNELKQISPSPQVILVKLMQKIRIANSDFYVIYPKQTTDGGNQDSIVLTGKLNGLSYLLTGDLECEGEAEIIQNFPNLKIDVLKVGHHGSKTSSSEAFIQKIQPSIALISCGINNRFKHPSEETLVTLTQNNVTIKRTDQNGMIYQYIVPYMNIRGFKTIK